MRNEKLFLSWFVGLIEGEGCFSLLFSLREQRARRLSVTPKFQLRMLAEEEPMFKKIASLLRSKGIIYQISKRRDLKNSTKWMIELRVSNVNNCLKFKSLLSNLGWYSQKKKDFAVWGRALSILEKKQRRTYSGVWKKEEILKLVTIYEELNLWKGKKKKYTHSFFENYNFEVKRKKNQYSIEEEKNLRLFYPEGKIEIVKQKIPERKWRSIQTKASKLGIKTIRTRWKNQ